MKRLSTLWCMVMLACLVHAGNTLTLSSISGHPDDEVKVSVTLANTDAVSALEMTVPLGEHLQYVDGSCELNSSRKDDHQLTATETEGHLKIYVYSIGLKNLKGTSGELLTFKLKLGNEPADYALVPNTVLSNAAGRKLDDKTQAGCVTLLSPKIEITTTSVDFGRIPIRSTYTQTLSIKNVGNEALDVTDIAIDNSRITASSKAFTVKPGNTENVTLTYSPSIREAVSATATVYSNAVNDVVMFQRQTASIKADAYSVNELHIATASGRSDSVATVALAINNMEPIVAMQCDIALPEALQYVDGSAKVLGRSGGHSVQAGVSNGVLSLYAYSADNSAFSGTEGDVVSFDVKLLGNSGQYMLTPTNVVLSTATSENVASAAEGNYVEIQSPEFVADKRLLFGSQSLTGEVTADYNITNNGKLPLVIDKVLFLSERYEVATTLPLVVNPGETAPLTIKHTPLAEGDFSAVMQVYSNDPECRMKSVAMSGNIYEPNSLSLSGSINADGSYTVAVSLDNYSTVVALQFVVRGLACTTFDNDNIVKTKRIANHNTTVTNIGDGAYLVMVYSMNNAEIAGNEGELMSLKFNASEPTHTTLSVHNIVISTKNGTNKNTGTPDNIDAVYGDGFGDVNGDGKITITDATTTIKYIANPSSVGSGFKKSRADMDGDGKITIEDVTRIINIIVNK